MSHPQPDGHLSAPLSGKGEPVLVLHAWWGLNDTVRAFCDRLAANGFIAFAPDLYHGKVATTIPDAEALSSSLDADRARADIGEAVKFLLTRAGSSHGRLAVIGFSMGAYFALELSNLAPDRIASVVVFYGTGHMDYGKSRASFLGHFAENDPYEPAESVDALDGALRAAGRHVTFHRYPGTGHWFFEPDRADAFNPAAAELAWERTLAFLWDTSSST